MASDTQIIISKLDQLLALLQRQRTPATSHIEVILPLLPVKQVFIASEVIERATNMDPALLAALASTIGINGTTTQRLGMMFSKAAGVPINGRRIKSDKTSGGKALWYVEEL